MTRFCLHGLLVDSAFEFRALPSVESLKKPDVEIAFGEVPRDLTHPVSRGVLYQAAAGEYLLRAPNIASFLVSSGRKIAISPCPNSDPARIETFLLTSVVTALLHQRGMLVLHGSAVAGKHGAVLLIGDSGAGKSTTAAALSKDGYAFVTDDVAALTTDGHAAFVESGSPEVRLWREAADHLGFGIAPGAVSVTPNRDKFAFRLSRGFDGPARVVAICCLENTREQNSEVEMSSLEGPARFDLLRRYTRLRQVMEGLKMQPAHFKAASQVSDAVPCYVIRRPARVDCIESVAGLIRPLLQECET